jgi:hypothetical protein
VSADDTHFTNHQEDRMTISFTEEVDPVVDTRTFVEFYDETVAKAARKEHKGSKLFDIDDLKQEAWLVLLPKWEKFHERGVRFVYTAAQVAMQRYAQKERIDYGYFSGAFIYTPEIVRTQLELGAWESTPEGDWDIRLDVRDAYEALGERDQHIVWRAYRLNESFESSTDRSTLSRAMDKMANYLNEKVGVRAGNLDDLVGVA